MKNRLREFIKKYKDTASLYGELLDKESLKSEIFRLYILMGIICFLIIYVVFIGVFYYNKFDIVFREKNLILSTFILLTILLFRELMVKRVWEKKINSGKSIPRFIRYINSFVEVSYPTIAIIALLQNVSSALTLFSPITLSYFIFIILSALELDEKLCLFVGTVAALEYTATSLYFLSVLTTAAENNLLNVPMLYFGNATILFVSGLISAFVTYQIKKRILGSFKIQEERNRIEKLFGQQVSKAVVDEIISTKKDVIGVKREVCIMFLDIRDYSKYVNEKDPEEIIKYQNALFSFMIDIVTEHNGIIHQILGDGFMASFGAPISYENDCLDAVNAALDILTHLKLKCSRGELPLTRIGIGIHTGEAVMGNVGNAMRKQYSISGNVVVIASRIEQLNKEYNSSLLISEEVLKKIWEIKTVYENLGEVIVKGSQNPIKLYKLA